MYWDVQTQATSEILLFCLLNTDSWFVWEYISTYKTTATRGYLSLEKSDIKQLKRKEEKNRFGPFWFF